MHMIQSLRFLAVFGAVLVAGAFLPGPSYAQNTYKEYVMMNYSQQGLDDSLAREALESVLAPKERFLQRPVILGTGQVDLNGDGVPELVVRIPENVIFCKPEGCPTYIYVVTENDLVEVGMTYANGLYVDTERAQGIHNLYAVKGKGNRYTKLVWRDQKYEEQKL